VRHIHERVVVADREVQGIGVRFEARPFFGDLPDGMAVAPPDGPRGSQTKAFDRLAWYAGAP